MEKPKMNIGKFLQNETYIRYFLYAVFFVILVVMIIFIMNKMNKKSTNNEVMKSSLENLDVTLSSISSSYTKDYKLRDYYVLSSYNTCCAGDFKNDYVDLYPLKQVIKHGARLLDFEIYSLNDKPVVAASSQSDFHIKETFNSLAFDEIMDTIQRYAFSAGTCANANDPLFLHFRVKSNNLSIYESMASSIKNHLSGRLLGKTYENECQGENIGNFPLKNFIGKVIIICDNNDGNFRKNKDFEKLVNATSNSVFLRGLRNYDVVYTHDHNELIQHNRKNMALVIPDLTSSNTNMKVSLHMKYGCQFNCLNFQNVDENLKYSIELFNRQGKAFMLKPKQLRYVPVTVEEPADQNPEYGYAPRTIEKPYFSHKI
jgi:hypothetical protein